MSSPAGGIDLFSGRTALTGTNKFKVDKDPTSQFNEGVSDVIGKSAANVGGQVNNWFTALIQTITGQPYDFSTTNQLLTDIDTFFTNVLDFLGGYDPLSNNSEQAAITFINQILNPTGLIATHNDIQTLVQDIYDGLGGTGTATSADLQTAFTAVLNDVFNANGNANSALTQLLTLIGGVGGTTIFDLVTWLHNVNTLSTDAWNQISDFIQTGDWTDLTQAWNDFVQMIFGTSAQVSLTGQIPSTSVVDSSTLSVQPVADFPNAQSISAGAGWVWDGSVDHTGKAGSGSAKATVSGAVLTLVGVLFAVQPGQSIKPSAWVQWSNVNAAAGTSPFQLQLIPDVGSPVTVSELTSVAISGTWQELNGSWVVPSGVSTLQIALIVTPDAKSGTVWWDDCTVSVSGGYLANLSGDLATLQNETQQSAAAFATLLNSWYITLTTSGQTFSQQWTAMESAWSTYVQTNADITAGEWATLSDIFNGLFGIDTTTGLIPQSKITDLEASGQNWTAAYDNVQNFLTTWNWTNLTSAWTDLNTALWGGTTGAVGTNIQHTALPSAYANIGADFNKLVNDLLNAFGGGWSNVGTDLENLVQDITGQPHTSTINALQQIPNTQVASTSGGSSLGADVTNAQNAANTVSTDLTTLTNDMLAALGLSKTGSASDVGNAFNTLMTDLFGSGATVGTNTSIVQQSAVPSGIPQSKIQNLEASGQNWTAAYDNVQNFLTSGNWDSLTHGWQDLMNALFGTTNTSAPGSAIAVTALPSDIPSTSVTAPSGSGTLSSDFAKLSEPFQSGSLFNPTAWADAWNGLENLLGVPTTNLPGVASGAQIASTQISSIASSPTGSNDIGSDLQTIADMIHQAVNGGEASGTPIANIRTNLQNLPQPNILINLGQGATSVSFDAVGSGGTATSSFGVVNQALTATGTHNCGTANILICAVAYSINGLGQSSNVTLNVTYGSQVMGSLGHTAVALGQTEYIGLFALWNPNSGSQTVTVSATGTGGNGIPGIAFSTVSYNGVQGFSGSPTFTSGGYKPSMTATSLIGGITVNAFTASDVGNKTNTAFSAYSATQRTNTTVQLNSLQYGYQALVLGDSTSATPTFSATSADSAAYTAGFTLVLKPTANAGVIGAGCIAVATAASTVPVTINTAVQWPAGTVSMSTQTAPYVTFSNSSGQATVQAAGWYMVEVGIRNPSGSTSQATWEYNPCVYVNNALYQYGPQFSGNTANYGQATFIVYLSPGQSVAPGVFLVGGNNNSIYLGTGTYFNVTLANRSMY